MVCLELVLSCSCFRFHGCDLLCSKGEVLYYARFLEEGGASVRASSSSCAGGEVMARCGAAFVRKRMRKTTLLSLAFLESLTLFWVTLAPTNRGKLRPQGSHPRHPLPIESSTPTKNEACSNNNKEILRFCPPFFPSPLSSAPPSSTVKSLGSSGSFRFRLVAWCIGPLRRLW